MDAKLLAWARAVKARRRARHPVLWLFTDARRVPDPLPDIAALPAGCGVVFRHDGVPGRAALAREVARICRARRLALTIAGDPMLAAALGAGQHLRAGGRPRRRLLRPTTLSAHDPAELRRAGRLRGAVVFLSPVFPTPSHPGARPLGPARFAAWAARCRAPVLALGGVDSRSSRRLSGTPCAGAGAIGAWHARATGKPL